MIFSNLLYIFQSEHYDRMRFLKFAYKNVFLWSKLSDRGHIDWTLRAKILMGLACFFWIGTVLLVWFRTGNILLTVNHVLGGVLFFPLLLIFADFLLTPLLHFQKQKIFTKAKKILEKLKSMDSDTSTGSVSLQVIGITGSYGKTSLKNILTKILETQFSVMTIPGNINTDLGVANYLISHQSELKNADFLVVEMGAYTTGEIQSICDVVHPDYSFLTAIAPVHLERFGSIENTAKAKFELPNATKKIAYLNAHDKNIQKFFPENSHNTVGADIIHPEVSKIPEISDIQFLPEFSGISFEYKTQKFQTKLISSYVFEFLEMIFPLAEHLEISLKNMQKGVSQIDYTPHRLEVIKNKQTGVTVIDDSYNGNFSGFVAGIKTLDRAEGRKIVLTPGIVELGEISEKVHADLAQLYMEKLDFVLLVENKNTKIIQKIFENQKFLNYKIYSDVHKSHGDLPNVLKKGDTILFQNDLSDNYA